VSMIKSNKKFGRQNGFTLVELLVVISVLMILAGVTISVLNPKKQRQRAEDGVRMSNLGKLALGIESYANANSKYPTVADMIPLADNKPTGVEAAVFISKIPNNEPTSPLTYSYEVTADQLTFGVSVPKASDAAGCFKYHSSWGKIKECSLANCGAGKIVDGNVCT